jgi:hypothetical protein
MFEADATISRVLNEALLARGVNYDEFKYYLW